jgi:peptidoglycan/LPS O-acetylase OafA/YrhL
MKNKQIYKSLDAWRAIACLFVVLVHLYGALMAKTHVSDFDVLQYLAKYGRLGVQIFFVISGYCITASLLSILKKNISLFQFIKARCRRIYMPYWLTLPASFAVQIVGNALLKSHMAVTHHVGHYYNIFDQSLKFWLSNLCLIQIPLGQKLLNGVAWSLCYEISFYGIMALIAFLVLKLLKGKNAAESTILLLHLFTILCFSLVLLPIHTPFPLNLWPEFGLGVLVYDFLNGISARKVSLGLFIVSIILGVACMFKMSSLGIMENAQDGWLNWLACIVFAILSIVCYKHDDLMYQNKAWRSLCHMGAYSYTIYLIHPCIVDSLSFLYSKFPSSGVYSMFFAVIVLSLCILLSKYLFLIVEKPFISISRKQQVADK